MGGRWSSPLGGWFLLVLLLQAACATGPRSPASRRAPEPGLESARVFSLGFLEPGARPLRPVPIAGAEFQQTLARLALEVRLGHRTPREAALEWLSLSGPPPADLETVTGSGEWLLETYAGQGYTLVPRAQQGSVQLASEADETLKEKYLRWCSTQGGGDCLGLLDDDSVLRTDDRRTLALALALGSVLTETRAALGRDLQARAVVSLVVWTVALYCMLWVVPEPTTKALAAALSVLLMSYLGLETVYGLMEGWARLADTAHHASTFEEVRAAGEAFGRVLGEDAARAMVLAVAALSGHTLGQVMARVKALPGSAIAGARWEAQGGAAVLGQVESEALAAEDALARAVVGVEAVATSPEGPLAVVLLKQGPGTGAGQAPGGRSSATVLRHRGGNRQVELSDGQRWHLPRGKSAADIPARDAVGDQLQEAVTRAASEWGPHRLSRQERLAIEDALKKGEYWLARLLEREARGRYVHARLKDRFGGPLRFNHQGVDAIDPATGIQYEFLSGSVSNLARHGRRMAGEFFRMITF